MASADEQHAPLAAAAVATAEEDEEEEEEEVGDSSRAPADGGGGGGGAVLGAFCRLLALLAILGLNASLLADVSLGARLSATFDEPVHVAAGASYWLTDDYRFNAEQGNLPQRLGSLPLVLDKLKLRSRRRGGGKDARRGGGVGGPSFAFKAAGRSAKKPPKSEKEAMMHEAWSAGEAGAFMYAEASLREAKEPASVWLRLPRLVMSVQGTLLCLLVFRWALDVFEGAWPPAILATLLCATSPCVLSQAPLVLSDTSLALWSNVHVYSTYRALFGPAHHRRMRGSQHCETLLAWLASCASFAAALLSKPTGALLIVPLGHSVLTACLFRRPGRALLLLLAVAATSLAAVWAAYSWRFEASLAPLPTGSSREHALALPLGAERLLSLAQTWRLLPEAFLAGARTMLAHSTGSMATLPTLYVDGRRVATEELGASYALRVLLYKLPTPWLALLAASCLVFLCRGFFLLFLRRGAVASWWSSLAEWVPLVGFASLWAFVAATSRAKHGLVRYMLPLHPALAIVAGGAAAAAKAQGKAASSTWKRASSLRTMAALLVGLVAALESLQMHPHYMAHFSLLAGGPSNGWRALGDSALDLGQGLPSLADFLRERNESGRIFLSYYGADRPQDYGIKAESLYSFFGSWRETRPVPFTKDDLGPGLYIISASMLSTAPENYTDELENHYQSLRTRVHGLLSAGQGDSQDMAEALEAFDQTCLLKLRDGLERRPPDEVVGHVFLVYDVKRTEFEQIFSARAGKVPSKRRRRRGRSRSGGTGGEL